jgi:hypothetical protein
MSTAGRPVRVLVVGVAAILGLGIATGLARCDFKPWDEGPTSTAVSR